MATLQLRIEDEAALVNRAVAGERAAFGELYEQYSRFIYRVALGVTGKEEDAEDVRQETFLKAYKHLRRFRGGAKFSTWLTQIARNESVTKIRARRGGRLLSLDDAQSDTLEQLERNSAALTPNPEVHHLRGELRAVLTDVLSALEPAFRSVFMLRAVEKCSTRQTARQLGISVPAVKSRLFRSRMKLRERLAGHLSHSSRARWVSRPAEKTPATNFVPRQNVEMGKEPCVPGTSTAPAGRACSERFGSPLGECG